MSGDYARIVDAAMSILANERIDQDSDLCKGAASFLVGEFERWSNIDDLSDDEPEDEQEPIV